MICSPFGAGAIERKHMNKKLKVGTRVGAAGSRSRGIKIGRVAGVHTSVSGVWVEVNFAEKRKPPVCKWFRPGSLILV